MSEVHRCPVCNGNGKVPNGFYNQTSGQWSSTSSAAEICKSCNGQGFIVTNMEEPFTTYPLNIDLTFDSDAKHSMENVKN